MERTEIIMGMPITVSIPHAGGDAATPPSTRLLLFQGHGRAVQSLQGRERSRPHEPGRAGERDASPPMLEVLRSLRGDRPADAAAIYAWYRGSFDPSAIVKGWCARGLEDAGRARLSRSLHRRGRRHRRQGEQRGGGPWEIGIRNPFDPTTIVKVLRLSDRGIATSGTYIRGDHIYNPKTGLPVVDGPASLTVVGPDVCEADRL